MTTVEPRPAPMIGPAYARAMAAYNAAMNRRLYASANRLPEAERVRPRGAYWGSIHGTLCHLLWGDRMWMSRFDPDRWERPEVGLRDSAALVADWAELARAREAADAGMLAWSEGLDEAWLGGELAWYSGAAGREFRTPRALLVMHLFNHGTHHRGQVHAMLTAAGETTGDTDLFLLVGPAAYGCAF